MSKIKYPENPLEAIDFVCNHKNYKEYLGYLETCKEELEEDSQDRVEKICNMFYMGSIGNGDRRVCCCYEDVLIKLPLESCHKESNYNEYSLYEYVKASYPVMLEYLCPILAYKNDLVVVPVCDELEMEYDSDEFFELREKIVDKFLECGVEFTDLDAPHQFGILDGKIVILDYEDYEILDASSDRLKPSSLFSY